MSKKRGPTDTPLHGSSFSTTNGYNATHVPNDSRALPSDVQNDAYGAQMLMGLKGDEGIKSKPKTKKRLSRIIKAGSKIIPSISYKRKRSGREASSTKGDKQSKKRRRIPISQEQKARLEHVFQYEEHPSREVKGRLASELGMEPRRVQIWFQNRRAKAKKELNKRKNEVELMQQSYNYNHYQQPQHGMQQQARNAFDPNQNSYYYTQAKHKNSRHKPTLSIIRSCFSRWPGSRRRKTSRTNEIPPYRPNTMQAQFAPPNQIPQVRHNFGNNNNNGIAPAVRLPRLAELDYAWPSPPVNPVPQHVYTPTPVLGTSFRDTWRAL